MFNRFLTEYKRKLVFHIPPPPPPDKLSRIDVLGKSVCIVRRLPGQYLDKILKANIPKVNFEFRFLRLIVVIPHVNPRPGCTPRNID